jgi:uncharacterized protein
VISLLDVSFLVPLLTDAHPFYPIAEQWFVGHRVNGWATSTITQSGFVRVAPHHGVSIRMALQVLEPWCTSPDHQFWPLDFQVHQLSPEIRFYGPKQLTDAILLELAIRRNGRLVTLDQRTRTLLPADSPLQKHIEVLGTAPSGIANKRS